MNKLVSRNSILRFKLGRKIIKAEEGAIAKWQRRIRSAINGIGEGFVGAFNMTFNPNNTQYNQNIYRYARNIADKIGNGLVVENYTPENGGTTNNRIRRERYQLALKRNTGSPIKVSPGVQDTAKAIAAGNKTPRVYTNTSLNTLSVVKPKLVNNVWIKGYNRRPEITDVRAMLLKLLDLGLLQSKYGIDGKWGKDTEAAYQKYLNIKNVPSLEDTIIKANTPEPELSSSISLLLIKEDSLKFKKFLGGYKQGGQLISKDPIKRFKQRNFR